MNKKIGKEISKIILLFAFTIIFQISFTSTVAAETLFCGSPLFHDEKGVGLDPIGTTTNKYVIRIQNISDSNIWTNNGWIKYNLKVKNNKNQAMAVCVNPESDIQSHVHGGCIFDLQPEEERNLTLELWIRQDALGILEITGYCDDGHQINQYIYLSLILYVNSFENVDPQGSCFPPPAGCQEDSRMFESYRCLDDGSYVAEKRCVDWCCKGVGTWLYDSAACCTGDGSMCISEFNLPPATEGSIALLCSNDKCNYENYLKRILRMQGYNVVGKSYRSWNEDEFANYNIIVCGYSGACKMDFNSPAYNAHVEKNKPILEIAQSRLAKAAYDFGYVSRYSASSSSPQFFAISHDSIVQNYYGSFVDVTKDIPRYSAVKNDYLDASSTISLAESGDDKGSIFFKVDSALGHGKYAYIGWMPQISVSGLTDDGKQILANTLSWLKQGEAPKKFGSIAFVCKSDKCNDKDEIFLIKKFRSFRYSVAAKSLKDWENEGDEISSFDLIVCRASNACKFIKSLSNLDKNSITSPIYHAHIDDGVPFLEIPDSSKDYAAYIFGYTDSYRGKSVSVDSIYIVNSSHPITDGYSGSINIFTKRRSVSGIDSALIHSDDIAYISTRSKSYATIFTDESSPRYAFLGFFPRSSSQYYTSNAIEILRRTTNWLMCGSIECS